MTNESDFEKGISGVFGLIVFAIAILNLIFVHPVPGVVAVLLSVIYLPQSNAFLKQRFEFQIPLVVKIGLGLFIIWFTLGISDLGDMIDKL